MSDDELEEEASLLESSAAALSSEMPSTSTLHDPPPQEQAPQNHPKPSRVSRTMASIRRRIWKKTAYVDKEHDFPGHPPSKVRMPMEYFADYYDNEFFINMAVCTNLYYMRQTGRNLNTNMIELRKIYGMHLLMGIFKYPRIAWYWRINIQFQLIATAMTRDRFFCVRNALHVVDNDKPPTVKNPLWKVQPVIDVVKKGCGKIERSPGRYSVDEQMIPFTGKCEMRQVVKNKPRPVGLKNFVTTNSEGLMMDFEIYHTHNPAFADRSLGLGPAIVIYLAQSIPPGSCIYFDRYFTTVPLLEKLVDLNLHGTGTIMMNRIADRQQVHFKEDRQMKRGDIDQRTLDDKIALVKWRDSKCVVMASNCTGGNRIEVVKRYDKPNKRYIDVDAPKVVTDYNRYMGGVDVLDQSMEYYRTFLKTRKWTLKVIIHFLDLAVVNCWRLYRCDSLSQGVPANKIMDLLEFRYQIAESLINTPDRLMREPSPMSPEREPAAGIRRYQPANPPSLGKRYDGYNHLPTVDKLKSPRSCRLESCSSRTKTRCRKCDVYLCCTSDNDCFYLYHTP